MEITTFWDPCKWFSRLWGRSREIDTFLGCLLRLSSCWLALEPSCCPASGPWQPYPLAKPTVLVSDPRSSALIRISSVPVQARRAWETSYSNYVLFGPFAQKVEIGAICNPYKSVICYLSRLLFVICHWSAIWYSILLLFLNTTT